VANTFNELAFSPTIHEIVDSRPSSKITILTGSNNSGKSAYLKKTVVSKDHLYVGVNRFYSFHHLPLHNEGDADLDNWFNGQQSVGNQQFHNFEGSYFSCSTAITRLKNDKRELLFTAFHEMFGIEAKVFSEDPSNEFSNRFVSVGGESLSVTSSGTRLFLGILAALMDERFRCVAIDEPELGLSPTLQRKLADIVIRGQQREELFPHDPHVILGTHSHIFLDRESPSNNFVVSKSGNLITAVGCQNFTELHDIQFRLLGNDLSELFLPDAVIFVEGETDKIYLERILALSLPPSRVVVEACGGDIAKRLNFWASSLGDIQLSPYRARTFVVYDKIKQAGIESICKRVGLPLQNMIEWGENGIEFVYPDTLISSIFRKQGLTAQDLEFDADTVAYGDVAYKKMELCKLVTNGLIESTLLPTEILEKLIGPIRAVMK
jgi:predicted ATPase